MPDSTPRIAVFLHLYDHTLADELVTYINQIPPHYHVDVLANIPLTDEEFQRYRQIDQKLRQLNPAFARHFFVTENRGRDIGGFFYLIYKVLLWEQQPDYVLFLHSKTAVTWAARAVNGAAAWRATCWMPIFLKGGWRNLKMTQRWG